MAGNSEEINVAGQESGAGTEKEEEERWREEAKRSKQAVMRFKTQAAMTEEILKVEEERTPLRRLNK
jgi:hypothetical protein